jgi:hypothetical protein
MFAHALNRRIAGVMLMVAALIAALAVAEPARSSAAIGAPTHSAPAVAISPARAADPAAAELATQQHVSLAQAETRMSWQRAVPALSAALHHGLPAARLGGIWIAPDNGDRVKVGLVAPDSHLRAIATRAVRAAGLSAATDLVPVRYSASQVVGADAWLSTQLTKLPDNRPGSIHLSVNYRMDLNRVELGVAGHHMTAAEQALIVRAKARYGDLIHVVAQPTGAAVGNSVDCFFPFCSAPLRGGIQIFNNNSGGGCTGAFIARSRVDGKLYQFTAGHCAVDDGTGTWSTRFADHSIHAIGSVHNYVLNSSGDEAILNINNPTGWSLPQGWVYVTEGPNTTLDQQYPIYSDQYSTQGARVCESGGFSGSLCGTVKALGQSKTECNLATGRCTYVRNLAEATFCVQPGDSGSPVFASHQAFGLVVAGGLDPLPPFPCVTYYQGIKSAENAMNVNIVLAH